MYKKVIISPCSRALRNGGNNPKNYPWWQEVVKLLQEDGIYVIQIGESRNSDPPIGANEIIIDKSLKELEKQVEECDTWAGVDNFFQHLTSFFPHKPGVVIWGISDPLLFGYPHNTNLLKDRKYLRPQQFEIWESAIFDEKVFVPPDQVVASIKKLLK